MNPGTVPMQPGNGQPAPAMDAAREEVRGAWLAFIRYCRELGYGEIQQLKIQDGLPVLAEVTRKKVKFAR